MIRSSRMLLSLVAAGLVVAAVRPGPAPAEPNQDAAGKTPKAVQVGEAAPDFELTDTQGKPHKLSTYLGEGKTVVLEWFNPDCPFVKKHHEKTRSMAETQAAATEEGVVWLAINSGAPGKQGNGPDRNRKAVEDYKIVYPVLLDESGAVGKAYGAKTTPHMYVIVDGKVVYAGAIDDRPDAAELGKTNYVRAALASVKAGKAVEPAETKPYGCSVKYAQ